MRVDYMVLADAASASDGKHYIHGGGWDTIFGRSFPVLYKHLAVAARLRTEWGETDQSHTIQLDVVDENGRSILTTAPGPLSGTVNMGRPAAIRPGSDQVFPIALNLYRLTFTYPGTYAAVLRIDQFEEARSLFNVVPAQEHLLPQP